MEPKAPVRLLVVEDSVVFRQIVVRSLERVEGIEVVGTARNGLIALEEIERLKPDVITLDLEMPVLDGLGTLDELRKLPAPPKVIVLSSHCEHGARYSLEALRKGAFDFVLKPASHFVEFGVDLSGRIYAAAGAASLAGVEPAGLAPGSDVATGDLRPREVDLLAIAISTGGPSALESLFRDLPADFAAPIVVVQHMPPDFTEQLADALDRLCRLEVLEAVDGTEVRPGRAIIAPGGWHLVLEQSGAGIVCRLVDGERENGCIPAADVTYRSVAEIYGSRALALVMTGMGHDGLDGARGIKAAGGSVIVQDEASAVVFGMPGAIVAEGLEDAVVPLSKMASTLTQIVGRSTNRAAPAGPSGAVS